MICTFFVFVFVFVWLPGKSYLNHLFIPRAEHCHPISESTDISEYLLRARLWPQNSRHVIGIP